LYTLLTIHWSFTVIHVQDLLLGRALGLHGASSTNAAVITYLEPVLGPVTLETVLFGAFCILFTVALYSFIQSGLHTWARVTMLSTIITMFLVSATHWFLQVFLIPANYSSAARGFAVAVDLEPAPSATLIANILLSDAIVLWRACVVWKKNKYIVTFSVFLVIATAAFCAVNIIVIAPAQDGTLSETVYDQPAFSDTAYGSAALFMSLVSNMCATLLIGYKAWRHRLRFRDSVLSGSTKIERLESISNSSRIWQLILPIMGSLHHQQQKHSVLRKIRSG